MTGQVSILVAVAVLLVALAVLGWLPAQRDRSFVCGSCRRPTSTRSRHYDYYRDQRDASLGLRAQR
jgi:hypothetical protein